MLVSPASPRGKDFGVQPQNSSPSACSIFFNFFIFASSFLPNINSPAFKACNVFMAASEKEKYNLESFSPCSTSFISPQRSVTSAITTVAQGVCNHVRTIQMLQKQQSDFAHNLRGSRSGQRFGHTHSATCSLGPVHGASVCRQDQPYIVGYQTGIWFENHSLDFWAGDGSTCRHWHDRSAFWIIFSWAHGMAQLLLHRHPSGHSWRSSSTVSRILFCLVKFMHHHVPLILTLALSLDCTFWEQAILNANEAAKDFQVRSHDMHPLQTPQHTEAFLLRLFDGWLILQGINEVTKSQKAMILLCSIFLRFGHTRILSRILSRILRSWTIGNFLHFFLKHLHLSLNLGPILQDL